MAGDETPADAPADRRRWRRALGSRRILLLVPVAALAATAVLLTTTGEDPPAPPPAAPIAEPRAVADPTAEDQLGGGHVALKVTSPQLLRTRPHADGQLVGRALSKTPYGSPTILPILKARGDWVAVVSAFRKNNRVTWTKVKPKAKFVAVEHSISVRVGDRSIIVRKNGKVIRRMKAAVGQVSHPTPPGRYAVTDGLIFKQDERGPYGCCALVLSARQTDLPAGWTGGDRVAIHGTSAPDSIGMAASLGCLRVGDKHARWLVENVPAGTTVFVRS